MYRKEATGEAPELVGLSSSNPKCVAHGYFVTILFSLKYQYELETDWGWK